jgi:hypothetical protein
VKHWEATLAIFAALSASIALADDFKTINGKRIQKRRARSDFLRAALLSTIGS